MKTFILKAITVIALALTPLSMAAAEPIAQGTSWENVKKRTSGDWSIEERDGAYYIEFADNFKTRKAPDLKVYLSTANAADLNDKNGIDGATFIQELNSHKGQQSYKIPEGIDPSAFTSLVIYCEAFSKFWAATSI